MRLDDVQVPPTSVKAWSPETGMIRVDLAYRYPSAGGPQWLWVASPQIRRLPRGHTQLLLVEDRRQLAPGQEAGPTVLQDDLTAERTGTEVEVPALPGAAPATQPASRPADLAPCLNTSRRQPHELLPPRRRAHPGRLRPPAVRRRPAAGLPDASRSRHDRHVLHRRALHHAHAGRLGRGPPRRRHRRARHRRDDRLRRRRKPRLPPAARLAVRDHVLLRPDPRPRVRRLPARRCFRVRRSARSPARC